METVLNFLKEKKIKIKVKDGELIIRAPKDALDEQAKATLRKYKVDLIQYLNTHKSFAPIAQVPVQESYPLSSSQQRFWIISQFDQVSEAYHIPNAYRLEGKLDIDLFIKAIHALVKRHEILRTSFKKASNGEVRQWISSDIDTSSLVDQLDVRKKKNKEGLIESYLKEATYREFDLENGPLIRFALIQYEEDQYIFFVNLHHIIGDGWSLEILKHDILSQYLSFVKGNSQSLPALKIQYKDYAEWFNQQTNESAVQADKTFWLNRFEGELPILDFPIQKPRPKLKTYNGAIVSTNFDQATTEQIKTFSQQNGTTLFMTLLAALNGLLHRYTNQTDIIIGTPISGRAHPDLENQIGLYINTLALRNEFSPETTFQALLNQTKHGVIAAQNHQLFPFERLIDDLGIKRDTSRSPLFDVMIILNSYAQANQESGLTDLQIQSYDAEYKVAKNDLTFVFEEIDGQLSFVLEYNTDLFTRAYIDKVAGNFKNFLQIGIDSGFNKPIKNIDFFEEIEKNEVLNASQNSNLQQEVDHSFVELFEEQVKQTPDNNALLFNGRLLTYAEVNAEANRLAGYLQERRIQPQDLIGIKLKRSEWSFISILAILKLGATFVPIDPDYPAERVDYIQTNSNLSLLIDAELLELYHIEKANFRTDNISCQLSLEDLAYVIYTSGSTGNPKGVMIRHRSLSNLVLSFQKQLNITETDSFLSVASFSFDMSILELFLPFIAGGKLIIADKDTILNKGRLKDLILISRPTYMQATPLIWKLLLADGWNNESGMNIICGGEAIEETLKNQLLSFKRGVLWNLYGPTETCVWSTIQQLKENEPITIGKPVYNTSCFILDENMQLLPDGVYGELYIGGQGVSTGYYNNVELTEERFVDNPYQKGEKLYRTGDLVKRLPDGNLEIGGRIDRQVKVRGFRIELGEIENAILSYQNIDQVVVISKTIRGEAELFAYVVGPDTCDFKKLREHIKAKLPHYMIPNNFVQLREIPLTPNGKLDVKRLPDTTTIAEEVSDMREAVTDLEQKVVGLWQEVFKKQNIGLDADFFDLGGSSIKLIQLNNLYEKQFNSNLNFQELFNATLLHEHVAIIEAGNQREAFTVEPDLAQRHEPFNLTPIQQAYYSGREDSFELGVSSQIYFDFESDEFDLERFRSAFLKLIERHDMLRAIFNDSGLQHIVSFDKLKGKDFFEIIDAQGKTDAEVANLLELNKKKIIDEGISLNTWPLFKLSIIQLDEGVKVQFLIDLVIVDGFSLGILQNDLSRLYNGETLKPLTFSFRDYISGLEKIKSTTHYQQSERYWRSRLDTLPLGPDLPLLQSPKDISNPEYYNLTHVVPPKIWGSIKKLSSKYKVSASMVMMTAFAKVLGRWSGNPHFLINLTLFNRIQMHPDVMHLVGDFTETMQLEMNLKGEVTLVKEIQQVQQRFLQDLNHIQYSGVEVNKFLANRENVYDRLLTPVVVTSVIDENDDISESEKENTYKRLIEQDQNDISRTAQVWIDNQIISVNGVLTISWTIVKQLFPAGMIEGMFNAFTHIINDLADEAIWLDHQAIELPVFQQEYQKTYNNVEEYFPSASMIDGFLHQVKVRPDAIALVQNDIRLTYAELDRLTGKVAAWLQSQGVQKEELVAVISHKSWWQIVAVIGIQKAGGAYIPIDASLPESRINYLLNEGNVNCALRQESIDLKLDEHYNVLSLSSDEVNGINAEYIPVQIDPKQLAYVIFTSGSTGKPKGVMIDHIGAVNTISDINKRFAITAEDSVLAISALSFDLSVYDVFGILAVGGKIVLPAYSPHPDPENWLDCVINEGVTLWNSVPQLAELFELHHSQNNKEKYTIKNFLLSGDWIPLNLPGKLKALGDSVNVISLGGATEASIWSIYYSIDKIDENWTSIPYGMPLANQHFYVLNEQLEFNPLYVTGDLYIGGDGLSLGYLNDTVKTDAAFITHPVTQERIYKTGDKGRWMPEGYIEFQGRVDDQVKIRGYRVELGEIESVLIEQPEIQQAIVVVNKDVQKNNQLIGYVVSHQSLDLELLRKELSAKLPGYMVPKYMLQLDEIPLTSNGKVNKRALPNPQVIDGKNREKHLALATEKEQIVAEVFQEVLFAREIGRQNSFYDLGGDSIKAIQVVSRIRERGYKLSIADILRNDTIEELALKLDKLDEVLAIDQAPVTGDVPITPIQHWLLQGKNADKHHFNQSLLLFSEREIDSALLQESMAQLVNHHDALRMRFKQENGQWKQENADINTVLYDYQLFDLTSLSEDEAVSQLGERADEVQRSFNLETGPLAKVGHFKFATGDYLLLAIHHLVVDGVSFRILMQDLISLYTQLLQNETPQLPNKTHSFKDWSASLHKYAQSDLLRQERLYWQSVLNVEVPNFPIDKPNGSNKLKDGKGISIKLSKEHSEALLRKVNKVYATEINDVLLTALAQSVESVLNVDKFVVMLEGHGREEIGAGLDITRTVGWFTSLFPVVLTAHDDLIESLITTKEQLRKIPNKGIGYGILSYLDSEVLPSVKPSITFNFLGDFGSELRSQNEDVTGFQYAGLYAGEEVSPDNEGDSVLSVAGLVNNDQLMISFGYSQECYNDATIEKLSEAFENTLIRLIDRLKSETATYLTPHDLTFKQLSLEDLKSLNSDNDIKDIYPLSPLQEGIYFHWKKDAKNTYLEQLSYRVKGALDEQVARDSYSRLLKRYDVLRTSFPGVYADRLIQVVKNIAKEDFRYVKPAKTFSTEEDLEAEVNRLKQMDSENGFDLAESSQMRLTVVDLGDNQYEFIWSFHHILMDGWCLGILLGDFYQIYNSLATNTPDNLDDAVAYVNYIQWLENIDKNVSLNYWGNYLEGYDNLASLPVFKGRSTLKKSRQDEFVLNKDLVASIKEMCKQNAVTESTFFQTVWGYVLSRYNNTTDVVFGSVVSGRPAELKGIESAVGLFSNTIPVRVRYKADTTTPIGLLKSVQKAGVEAQDHHYISLAEVQAQSELGANLLDHIIVFENYPIQEMVSEVGNNGDGPSLEILKMDVIEQTNYDFNILIAPASDSIQVSFLYNETVYEPGQIAQLNEILIQTLNQFLSTPDQVLGTIEEIKDTLMVAKPAEYPADKTLVDYFQTQVKNNPDNDAVVYNDEIYTYQALDELSNQFAHYLQDNVALVPDTFIGIELERSPWLITSILAVLKSGAAYVPIDPVYPNERKDYIKNNSQCKFTICKEVLKDFQQQVHKYPVSALKNNIEPENLAYMIYTSGTTGNPKGVMVEHRNVVSLLFTEGSHFDFDTNDTWTLFHSYCFDFSVWEIFGALLFGGKLVIVPTEVTKDPNKYVQLLDQHRVTILNQTPSAFYHLTEAVKLTLNELALRYVIFGGEALAPERLTYWANHYPQTKLINMYGITETTVHVTYKAIGPQEIETGISNIGKPLPSLNAYVLDPQQRLLPQGAIGELYVGGHGVARGYWQMDELTKERFVKLPFEEGARFYRTGDLVRVLPNGEMEYKGRADDQVKIRGHRIELKEVEKALQSNGYVKEAVVLVKETEGTADLIAYLQWTEEQSLGTIRDYLKKKLPAYMIPNSFVTIEELPLTANGKVNKKKLLSLATLLGTEQAYVAPQTEEEKQLITIWQNVLEREPIGMQDNFFDVGGDSIKAIRVLSQVNKAFSTAFEIADIYHNQSPALLIELKNTKTAQQVDPEIYEDVEQELLSWKDRIFKEHHDVTHIVDVYPMSDIERGMVFASMLNPGEGVYHDQFTFPIVFEKFDADCFEQAVHLLIGKHEILRTAFNVGDYAEPLQFVYSEIEKDISYADLSNVDKGIQRETIVQFMQSEIAEHPFELTKPGLWRMRIFNLGSQQRVLLFQFHHAILDGWSVASFITELNNTYLALLSQPKLQLKSLQVSNRDYVKEEMVTKLVDREGHFWQDYLADYKRLDILTDVPINEKVSETFHEKIQKQIVEFSEKEGVSIKTICFAAYLYLLRTLSYDHDITAGLITNTRLLDEEGDQLLGCFLNSIPFRTEVESGQSWISYVRKVDKQLIRLKAFEKMTLRQIKNFMAEGNDGGNPFFDTVFNFTQFHVYNQLNSKGFNGNEHLFNDDITYDSFEQTNTLFDVSISNTGNILSGDFFLRRELRQGMTLSVVAKLYERILEIIVDQPFEQVRKLDVLEGLEGSLMPTLDFQPDLSKSTTLLGIFQEMVQRYPQNIAISTSEIRLNYQELDEKSNALAHYLMHHSAIEIEDFVAVELVRDEWAIIAILAVMKTGAAYVPIDPNYPDARKEFLREDSQCKLVVNDSLLEDFKLLFDQYSIAKVEREIKPRNLAYMIYTSGTTGNPKGVMIEHGAICNTINVKIANFKITNTSRVLQLFSLSFDASVADIFQALLAGAELCIINDEEKASAIGFESYMVNNKVSVATLPPVYLQNIDLSRLTYLKVLATGGEAANPVDVQEFTKQGDYVNCYGPTETSICGSMCVIEKGEGFDREFVPIGRPIANVEIFMMDTEGNIVPNGTKGELCIGGVGLARGYWNRPDLTRERFIAHPYKTGERLYRTGDLARFMPDGLIQYLGRVDHQVKIRGFRIELGEIEAAISSFEAINNVVVLINENKGEKELIAFLKWKTASEELVSLRAFLKSKLPDYMLPAHYITLEEIPVTTNGKVNKNGLLAMVSERGEEERVIVAPTNEEEQTLLSVWQEVLGNPNIGITDNFFEVGGDSIKVMRVHKAIAEKYPQVPIVALFTYPTIENLIDFLRGDQNEHIKQNIDKEAEEAFDLLTENFFTDNEN